MKNYIKTTIFLFIASIFLCSYGIKQASAQWITETIVESYYEDYITANPIGYGPDNTYHVVFEKKIGGFGIPTFELWYTERAADQTWTEPVMISEPDVSTVYQSIEVSPEGDVYIGYELAMEGDYILLKKNEETWDEIEVPQPEETGSQGFRSLKVDHNGNIHVVWGRRTYLPEDDIYVFDIIYARNIDDNWEVISIPNSSNQYKELKMIDVADDGTIHILAEESTENGNIPFYLTNRTDDESGWERINLETSYATHTITDIECHGPDVNIVFEGRDEYFDPANIHYVKIEEGVVNEPIIIDTGIDAIIFSFTLDSNGDPVLAYGEDMGWDPGSLYLGYIQNGEFTDTLLLEPESEPLDAYLSTDNEGNLIAMLNLGMWEPNIYIMYEEMIPEFSVTFNVMTIDDEPLTDAVITLDEYQNDPGDYTFEGILQGTYNYIISKEGFQSVEGEIIIEDQDMEIDIHMPYEEYSVVFSVMCADQEPISDASITLAEQTNDPGDYTFDGIQPGTYDYLVIRDGYFPEEGEITITDHNLELDIQLNVDNTGLNDFTHISLDIFPNPASERVEISADGLIKEVVMYDMSGKIIQSCKPNSRNTILTINGVPTGIYIFRVKTDEGIYNRKLSVFNN